MREFNYFHKIYEYLEKYGYKKELICFQLHMFSKISLENPFTLKLKNLIKEIFLKNNYKKVVIITHSMLSRLILNILNSLSKEWKDKYI